MTNSQLHAAIALASVLIVGTFVAFVPHVPPASAQSQAHRICREQGVTQRSEGYEYCMAQVIRALESGEPHLAKNFARVVVEAREACLGYGLQADAPDFRTCIDRESYHDDKPNDLADAIRPLLSDSERYRAMSAASLELFTRRLNWANAVDQAIGIFKHALKARPGAN
jgi:hypothetical protein